MAGNGGRGQEVLKLPNPQVDLNIVGIILPIMWGVVRVYTTLKVYIGP